MKAKALAVIYNDATDKETALKSIKENFILEFKRLRNIRPSSEIHQVANIYCELEVKWMAFSLRTDVDEEQFHEFMAEAYPVQYANIKTYLNIEEKVEE